jgi:hypothetical protein
MVTKSGKVDGTFIKVSIPSMASIHQQNNGTIAFGFIVVFFNLNYTLYNN